MFKEYGKHFFRAVFAVLLMSLLSVPVFAAGPKLTDLGYSEIALRGYTEYDLNGDGTADKLSIELEDEQEAGDFGRLVVKINNKALLTRNYGKDGTFGIHAAIIKLLNGRTYLFLEDAMMHDYVGLCSLFRYTGTKLVKSFDFRTLNGHLWFNGIERAYGIPTAVSGNTITFTEHFHTPALGSTDTQLKISYKGGKLQPASSYGKITAVSGKNPAGKKYKLLKDVSAYETGTSTRLARKFKKGSLLKLSSFCIANGTLRFRVVNSAGRSGYVNALNACVVNGIRRPYFEGLGYAG